MNTDVDYFQKGYEIGLSAQDKFRAKPRRIMPYAEAKRRMDIILGICCGYFGITLEIITRKGRSEEVRYPRQITQYFLRELSGLPVNKIGQRFNQDHSTVCHSHSIIKDLIKAKDDNVCYDEKILNELINKALNAGS